MLQTPILFLVFNRPDTTQLVFNKIREQQPRYLYVAADGWRNHKAGEKELCLETRAVIDQIDWDCDVKTLFRDSNLGCGHAVSEAITWFFNQVEQGIILEDDCLPEDTFFPFCEELLERYKDDERVMHISGSNFQLSAVSDDSYYFTNDSHMWGWASWKRAWKLYDFKMQAYNSKFDFSGFLLKRDEKLYWHDRFSKTKSGKIDTWDYQWYFACWYNKGLSIMPQHNLVKNLGFREDGTHTTAQMTIIADLKTYPLHIVKHPAVVERNVKADYWQSRILEFYKLDLYEKILIRLKNFYIFLEGTALIGPFLKNYKKNYKKSKGIAT